MVLGSMASRHNGVGGGILISPSNLERNSGHGVFTGYLRDNFVDIIVRLFVRED